MGALRSAKFWPLALSLHAETNIPGAKDLPTLDNTARQATLVTLLRASAIVSGAFTLLTIANIVVNGSPQTGLRVVAAVATLAALLLALRLVRKGHQRIGAYTLVLFYGLTANFAAAFWGVNNPFALIMMGITIVLAGFVIGSVYAVYAAGLQAAALVTMQRLWISGVLDWSGPGEHPAYLGEAIAFSVLFAALGLITWLFGRQVEASLRRAWRAEHELQKERDQLEVRLRERTESLRALQLQEMKQLYRFAELGQMSTALLHDLANRLTTLTLDIEELGGHSRHDAVERARESIAYLDELVGKVSLQLHEQRPSERFDVLQSVHEIQANAHHRLVTTGVRLHVQQEGDPTHLWAQGDALRFGQVLTILLGNAIDAAASADPPGNVEVVLEGDDHQVELLVRDWGPGIAKKDRARLFRPFYTTKTDGMGVGLFIARQLIETHFKGSIELDQMTQPTTFKIILPHKGAGHGTASRGGKKTS